MPPPFLEILHVRRDIHADIPNARKSRRACARSEALPLLHNSMLIAELTIRAALCCKIIPVQCDLFFEFN
jgi:hypothetical protein